jgi:hypothetical protein
VGLIAAVLTATIAMVMTRAPLATPAAAPLWSVKTVPLSFNPELPLLNS